MKNIFKNILLVAVILLQLLFIKIYLLGFYKVTTRSMEPALQKGDVLLISKAHYELMGINISQPEIGDIVVFLQNGNLLVKRVIAKEHEFIYTRDSSDFSLKNNTFKKYSGNNLDESRLSKIDSLMIEKKHYFMKGDNHKNSYDSRKFGTISQDSIIGKLLFKL